MMTRRSAAALTVPIVCTVTGRYVITTTRVREQQRLFDAMRHEHDGLLQLGSPRGPSRQTNSPGRRFPRPRARRRSRRWSAPLSFDAGGTLGFLQQVELDELLRLGRPG